MDKRALINRLCERVTGGRAAVAAAYLGISESKFNNHLYENKGSRFFSVDELVALQTLSGSSLVAEYFAARSDAIVVPTPSAEVDTVELHHMCLNTAVKRSAVDQLILEAIRNHGSINEQAQQKILEAHRKHIATRDGEIRATLQVYGK